MNEHPLLREKDPLTRQDYLKYYVNKIRRITPGSECEACRGVGHYSYSNGGTWRRGGIATQAFQEDICDHCWGSGNKHQAWTDIRAIEDKFKAWEEDQVFSYLHNRLGLSLEGMKYAMEQLVEFCRKQERKRKIPAQSGLTQFWWSHTWHAMGNMLNKLYERRPISK